MGNLAVVGLPPQTDAVLGREETKKFFLHALGGDAPVEIQLIDGWAIADTRWRRQVAIKGDNNKNNSNSNSKATAKQQQRRQRILVRMCAGHWFPAKQNNYGHMHRHVHTARGAAKDAE